MLEVDLATLFNPRCQQLYVNAQRSCQLCEGAVDTLTSAVGELSGQEQPETSVTNEASQCEEFSQIVVDNHCISE